MRPDAPDHKRVRVRGARDNNLKDVDVDLPRDALVVFSGVSGSGKSSLAFGTLYAEAQRRYFASVRPYARRLFDQAGVPDVDSIDGLPPAVALQQQRHGGGARSTVGSLTTLHNFVRMLYSRAGQYPRGAALLYAEDFSANLPQGACPTCHGLGAIYDVTESSMVPDATLSVRERAIAAWPPAWHGQNLRDILVTLGYDVDTPWRDLSRKDRDWILFTDETPTVPVYAGYTPAETRRALRRKEEPSYQGTFSGARRYVLQTFRTTQSALMKKRVARFMSATACPECDGKRLKRAALAVHFAGLDIAELSRLSLDELAALLKDVAADGKRSGATAELAPEKRLAAQRIAQNVLDRIRTLAQLGLGYLTMERGAPTLSPGELQRLRLATQIHANLFGVVYVLDEPSAGLHPADTDALMRALGQLKAAGNSLFVVEHDLDIMRQADWIIDVGPGAGELGGRVLYSGELEGLRNVAESQTAQYLFATQRAVRRTTRTPHGWLQLQGVWHNNLRDLEVRFPTGVLTVITGVSGSGKSSLISHALTEIMAAHLGKTLPVPETDPAEEPMLSVIRASRGRIASGGELFKRMVAIDQKPIGRTPRSNLATYTGFFDEVRKLFAATKMARSRRFNAGRFSFNIAEGRCATCEGEGFVSVELLFMPSVYAPCSTCHGARYNDATLEVLYEGKNIAGVLAMTVDEAALFFGDTASIARPLELLRRIGLGYLRLGQPATELSGGEAQRIKLATELQRVPRGATLYVIDEPTVGLHAADVDKLMTQIETLVDAGNTVVLAEHEMSVAAMADWIIDMGPGPGDAGGTVVVAGTPRDVAAHRSSRTAPYLARFLG